MDQFIKVRGARQHNLKNIDLDIPKHQLVVFTGLSGSGKSSLAFDTIYAEGQRRYVESLSSYARQFLGVMDKPDVDLIEGLSPAISIDQKSTSHNPRSTVGTVTEIYDYLRLLFARIGHPHCPNCGREIERQSVDQMVASMIGLMKKDAQSLKGKVPMRYLLLSPIVRDRKGEYTELLDNLKAKGFTQARIDGHLMSMDEDLVLIKTNKHTIEAVTDKITLSAKELSDQVALGSLKSRLSQTIEQSISLSDGLVVLSQVKDPGFSFPDKPKQFADHLFSERFSCPVCNISIPEIEPRNFSFNSPHGACPTCTGIGTLLKIDASLVFNPNLTIAEGGILPYAKMVTNDTWRSRTLQTVADEHGINLRIPTGQLPEDHKKILLEGTGGQLYRVEGDNRFGRKTAIYEQFPGIIADLERRFKETESSWVRSEIEKFMRVELCPECKGARLKKDALSITIKDQAIVDITTLSITTIYEWAKDMPQHISEREQFIAKPILKEIEARLGFLVSVGLEYLTLNRAATTLSGGEAQRIRLASQIGSGLTGVLYVLDEPSIGLHQKDNMKLIQTLKKLKDLGNTVVVVEHDKEVMEAADFIFDFGPGAGRHGGQTIFAGTPRELLSDKKSVTGRYLREGIKAPPQDAKMTTESITIVGATENNLKNVTAEFPLGKLICVTGVSGSGKSTLVVDTLYHSLAAVLHPLHRERPGKLKTIKGLELVDKIILVDQSPIGRTPRSNPATYTGVFTQVRDLFASMPASKTRGYSAGRFSFNVKGGRCEACEGEGQIKIEMQFLADVYVKCEVCHGRRYNAETLEVKFKGKDISEVLSMTVEEALEFFVHIPSIADKLQTLRDVGLTYVALGQPAPTLSGGEAQRTKLAAELTKRQTGRTVYILDEPTTGLHFADLEKLLVVLRRLVEKGNTIVVIEHNLDIIKNADYLIDMGPEGGDKGGEIVATGTPTEVAKNKRSYTGEFLKKVLK